ncbi:MAG: aminopeptidase P N-terminal domain-containing protein [Tannerella sp.]|jgi:Xaa-Pro aminopeptidase|nr:aminopeptidase P N-terminal domain-containing protein [Tannerella sp.]
MFKKETYTERRAALKKAVGTGLLLFLGNDESSCNYADNTYPFRQDSSFLYFFGLPFAGLAAVIDLDEDRETVFGDELTMDAIVWTGARPTLREKSAAAGICHVKPSRELEACLREAVRTGRPVHYLPSYRPEHQIKLWRLLGTLPDNETPSTPFVRAVVNLRNCKTEEEIAEIEKACRVSAEMHLAMIRTVRPGIRECEVAAAVEAVAAAQNCRLSFPTIATVNGQTLHNHDHGNRVKSGDLFLLDAGAETETGYAGDLSTTVPADPVFTARQRDIHDIQQASCAASVAALRPGIRFEEVYDLSARIIVDGLKSLGLMRGDAAEAVAAGAHALFYPHGLGHMMGLDVHDMENLGELYVGYDGQPRSRQFGRRSLRLARRLEPGFVHTIEPGIYFIPELIDQWHEGKRFADFINYDRVMTYRDFGGIRNEDDYLITDTGARLLGTKISRKAEDLEKMRGELP